MQKRDTREGEGGSYLKRSRRRGSTVLVVVSQHCCTIFLGGQDLRSPPRERVAKTDARVLPTATLRDVEAYTKKYCFLRSVTRDVTMAESRAQFGLELGSR
jgi:hypothetical protein